MLIFLFQVSIPPEAAQEFVYRYGFIPEKFSRALSDGLITGIIYSIWPIICSMFMHGNWLVVCNSFASKSFLKKGFVV